MLTPTERRNAVNRELTEVAATADTRHMPTYPTRTAPGEPYGSDHSEYVRAVARMIRAAGRRAGDADPVDLAELVELRYWLDLAIAGAVVEQRERFSLAELADALGVTRQAVHKMHATARATITAHTMDESLRALDRHVWDQTT